MSRASPRVPGSSGKLRNRHGSSFDVSDLAMGSWLDRTRRGVAPQRLPLPTSAFCGEAFSPAPRRDVWLTRDARPTCVRGARGTGRPRPSRETPFLFSAERRSGPRAGEATAPEFLDQRGRTPPIALRGAQGLPPALCARETAWHHEPAFPCREVRASGGRPEAHLHARHEGFQRGNVHRAEGGSHAGKHRAHAAAPRPERGVRGVPSAAPLR